MKESNKLRSFLNSFLLIPLLIVPLIFLSLSLHKELKRRTLIKNELRKLEKELVESEKRKEELAQFLEDLKSDAFLEKQAKEKLNLKKQGEEVISVFFQESKAIDLKGITSVAKSPKPNYHLWWEYILGR